MLQIAEEEEVDEAFYRQPKAVSKSWALVHGKDFNSLDFCWRTYTVMYKLSRRLLESIENALLLQVVEDPTRNCVA